MNAKRHALLAKQLIAARGGLENSAAICRVKRSMLARYTDARSGMFMPADVIHDLESYGEATYSRALADSRPGSAEAKNLLSEIFGATEATAKLQATGRQAFEDGKLSATEKAELGAQVLALEEILRDLRDAYDRTAS